ncbi:MAG: DegT/DnrJ/EryC1/StrS family aminotransferase [Coraliomargarita sp.]
MSRIYLSPPDIGPADHDSVDSVLTSNWVAPVGPHLETFEQTLAGQVGRRYAVALNSGTAALHLALRVLGLGPDDAVVCPTLTFAASANPICYCGAEPVFVDSELETWNLDPDLLEMALQERSDIRAVIVVHLYGQCAQMERIVELCKRHNVALIEDAAEALGASWRGQRAGSFGDLSFFSFNGNKIITTSAGGMLLGDQQELIEHALYLATQAREPVLHYEHQEVGFNYRMSNMLAGLGQSQLEDLPRRIKARHQHFEAYTTAFSRIDAIEMMPISAHGEANYWLSCFTINSTSEGPTRDQVIQALADADIEARPLWKPMHQQPIYEDCVVYGGAVAADLFERGLCLPSGSSMTESDRARVIETVCSAFAS